MTNDLDRMIDRALEEERRAPDSVFGREPGYFEVGLSLFKGPRGWANILTMATQIVMFAGGVWLALLFFQASDPLTALKTGLPAGVLLILAMITKTALVPFMAENRLMLELRRLELRVERLRSESGREEG
ncbi:MAG: hypothetical protein RIA71_09260 [Oceanicaulis sp.]